MAKGEEYFGTSIALSPRQMAQFQLLPNVQYSGLRRLTSPVAVVDQSP
jgi:hypothetical protein